MRKALLAALSIGWIVVGAGVASAAVEDQVGLFDPDRGVWYLREADGSVNEFFYGIPGDTPLFGDWDCDGTDTVGMYRASNGFVYLRNSNDFGVADVEYFYGIPGDIPLAGDWNGDGCDTVAIYRNGRVFIRNALGTGFADFDFWFGIPGDRPFAGDFDGNGIDSLGLRRQSTGFAYLRDSLTTGAAETEFFYGIGGDLVIAGDWDGDADDTVGIFRPGNASFFLSNENEARFADSQFPFGAPGWLPVAGDTLIRNARLEPSFDELDFGVVGIGAPVRRTLRLTFAGPPSDPPIEIASVRVEGAARGEYEVFGPASSVAEPGETLQLEVALAPQSLGGKPATLVVRFTGANSPLEIPLFGTGAYRVNAGGLLGAVPGWSGDTAAAPSPYVGGPTDTISSAGQAVDPADTGAPGAVLQSYRFGPMQWDFPVLPGSYEVTLFFAETFGPNQSVGARVFDVAVEGAPVLEDFDIFSQVGGFTGTSRTFEVVSDGNLDIDFFTGADSPAVHAIEIRTLPSAATLGASPVSINLGSVAVGGRATGTFEVINLAAPGGPPITITSATISNSTGGFSLTTTDVPVVRPGESVTYTASLTPSSPGTKTATATITFEGGTLVVPVRGDADDVIVYRVNAGGPDLSGTLVWNSDEGFVSGVTGTTQITGAVDVADVSLPSGTPATLFQSERFGVQSWDFSLSPGNYEVRLYFAEIFHSEAGRRRFNVNIEGSRVLTNYDIFVDAGGAQRGVMRPFVLNGFTGGRLDIDLSSGAADQPTVQGIEVVRMLGPAELTAGPPSLNFGTILSSETSERLLTLSHTGPPGSPSITLDPATAPDPFSGVLAGQVIPPGGSLNVTLGFSPPGTGTHTASLVVNHDGPGSPLVVPLTGQVNDPPTVTDPGPQSLGEGEIFTLPISASDPDGTSPTVNVTGLPGWAFFLPSPPTITGTPGFDDAGTSSVTISASDGQLTTSVTFTLNVENVNRPPVLTPPGSPVVAESTPLSLTITASDPDGDSLALGVSGLTPWLSFTDNGNGTGVLSGTPGFEDAGVVPLVAAVNDGSVSDTVAFTLVVTNTNRPPELVNPGPQTVAEGEPFSLALSFSDPDGDPVSLSLSGAPPWVVFNSGAGTLTGTPGFSNAGSSTVTVTASDGPSSTPATFTLTVTNTNRAPTVADPGPQSATVGVAFSLPLSINDPDGDPLTIDVTGLPAWATFAEATRTISGTPTAAGASTVTVDVSDGSLSDTVSFTITASA